jgi:hypothetical protein
MKPETLTSSASEITVLDLLVVVTANLKLLVLGPIIVGLLAWGVASKIPKTFISSATIALPERELLIMPPAPITVMAVPTVQRVSVMLLSPRVLDVALATLNPLAGQALAVQRESLAAKVRVEGAADGTIRLYASADSAEQAQKTTKAIIDAWLTTTVPRKRDRAEMELRLLEMRASLRALRFLINHPTFTRGPSGSFPSLSFEERSALMLSLNELQALRRDEIILLEHALEGLDSDVVLQAPTLPSQQARPNVRSMVVLAIVITGFVLLLFVLLRHAWHRSVRKVS